MESQDPRTQRRRSKRVTQTLPIVIRGIDLLGQPFEERTATLNFNLHGCRYASKHQLPPNTWVTLEAPSGSETRNTRARVAWIQRPHSVREFFQVAVELEMPANIWAFQPTPSDWYALETPPALPGDAAAPQPAQSIEGLGSSSNSFGILGEQAMREMNETVHDSTPVAGETGTGDTTAESPLLRELSIELKRRAREAAEDAASQAAERLRRSAEEAEEKRLWASEESFRKWKEEFEQTRNEAREHLVAQHSEILGGVRSEFEQGLSQARHLIDEIEKNRHGLRRENEAAAEAASRVAQARLELEAVEAARRAASEPGKEPAPLPEEVAASWRAGLQSETRVAQAQWSELLQSSLDSGVNRIAEHLSARVQEISSQAGLEMSRRLEEFREPLAKAIEESRETLNGVTAGLDRELAGAKESLAEIERSATRMSEFSGQVEASTRDTVNELNRRLLGILDAQTLEMGDRAEAITAQAAGRAASNLEALKEKCLHSATAEIEAQIAPHLERLPQILREASNRELQMEESLRLHRERLRQVSEHSEQELASHVGVATQEARKGFEAARHEALTKWNEELEASGVRASHAAAESMERTSQSFEQEARARLQTLVEQTLAATATNLDSKVAESRAAFASALETEASGRAGNVREQLDRFSAELTGRARTQIEQAAEVGAAAFGQVLRGISNQEVEHFTNESATVILGKAQELESSVAQLLRNFETSAEASLARFDTQMAAQLDSHAAEGRSALAAEFNAILAGYQSERDIHQKEWLEQLARMSDEATGRHQERLNTAGDSWMVSSVRRLNEHGQNIVESLMRSADQVLRDSCARFFDGLAETLRDRSLSFSAIHPADISQQAAEAVPAPPHESAPNQPSL